MRIVIAGGRDFKPDESDREWLKTMLMQLGVTEVVSGKAKGADTFGEEVAKELGIKVVEFPADWLRGGTLTVADKSAGHERNEEMAKYADICILFPGGSGTASMERFAKQYGLTIVKRDYPNFNRFTRQENKVMQ